MHAKSCDCIECGKRATKEWLNKYRDGLVARGLSRQDAEDIDPEIDLTADPDDCAADEASCWAEDAEPIEQ